MLRHNVAFVGGRTVKAGDTLTKFEEETLKASGTKYIEAEEEEVEKVEEAKPKKKSKAKK